MMRSVVINLTRATARRARMQAQFEAIGLDVEFHAAVDGRQLQPADYDLVDREFRRRAGLWPQADGSIANWLSQRQVMQQLVERGPDLLSIFEDDARVSEDLPEILATLARKPFDFDVVKLNRRADHKRFLPCRRLTATHAAGRLKYSDYGSEGYVITRDAARHLLTAFPRMQWEIDHLVSRFWDNGLNVFYVDPPVVHHDAASPSQIETDRGRSRRRQRMSEGVGPILWRRSVSAVARRIRQRQEFARLQRGEIGITRWPSEPDRPQRPVS